MRLYFCFESLFPNKTPHPQGIQDRLWSARVDTTFCPEQGPTAAHHRSVVGRSRLHNVTYTGVAVELLTQTPRHTASDRTFRAVPFVPLYAYVCVNACVRVSELCCVGECSEKVSLCTVFSFLREWGCAVCANHTRIKAGRLDGRRQISALHITHTQFGSPRARLDTSRCVCVCLCGHFISDSACFCVRK